MVNKPMRVVIIGSGMIANKAHIPAYRALGDAVEIVAVYDPYEESAKGTAERHGIAQYYTDAEEMIKATSPDIVSVCSPNASHKAMTRLALNNGAHVVCEKPLAMSYADTKELFDLADEKGISLIACQVQRYNNAFAATRGFYDDGVFGDVYYSEISLVRRRGIPKWGMFHLKEANGGGAFCDLGVHMVDSVLWMTGNPAFEAISGMATAHIAQNETNVITSLAESGAPAGVNNAREFLPSEFEVEEFAAGSMRLAGGASVNFKISWAVNLPPEFRIEMAGTKAGIVLPDMQICSTMGKHQADITPRLFNEGRYRDKDFSGHYYLVEDFIRYLDGKGPIPVRREETLNVAAVIDAFYISAEQKREVKASEVVG